MYETAEGKLLRTFLEKTIGKVRISKNQTWMEENKIKHWEDKNQKLNKGNM